MRSVAPSITIDLVGVTRVVLQRIALLRRVRARRALLRLTFADRWISNRSKRVPLAS